MCWRVDGLKREINLRLGFFCFCAATQLRAAFGRFRRLRDQLGVDNPRRVAARDYLVRLGSFSEQPVVATIVVYDLSGRRFDSIPRFAPESHRCAHDLLATAATAGAWSQHFFCDLLLSR